MVKKNHKKNINKIECEIIFFLLRHPFNHLVIGLKNVQQWDHLLFTFKQIKSGLFISFGGDLGINQYIQSPNNSKDICTPCEKPCLTVCPVSALNKDGYDVARCKDYLNTLGGQHCTDGCLVRRSCPTGQALRMREQSNFHMKAFLNTQINGLRSGSETVWFYQTADF